MEDYLKPEQSGVPYKFTIIQPCGLLNKLGTTCGGNCQRRGCPRQFEQILYCMQLYTIDIVLLLVQQLQCLPYILQCTESAHK